jgi:hypothetical protein
VAVGTLPAHDRHIMTTPDTQRPATDSKDLIALAERLRSELPSVVPEYGRGKERIVALVARALGVGEDEAAAVVEELIEKNLVHYNDARSPGVPGHWEVRADEVSKDGAAPL